ncbi:hypothetical protein [Lacunimicrobium album]
MSFARRVLVYGRELGEPRADLSARVTSGCWFELHRQGGCGDGELRLKVGFGERGLVEIGEWVAFEYEAGVRWYLGRVESRETTSPAEMVVRLNGMSVELGEVFPGGFANGAAGISGLGRPHRFGVADPFHDDPDYGDETFDLAASVPGLVETLMTEYALPSTRIQMPAGWCDIDEEPGRVSSLKFRGEESLRSILKDLAVRAGNASWGVDAQGKFYFTRPPGEVMLTLKEGVDVLRLEESRDHQTLFNRLLLTGDYVYDLPEMSGQLAQRAFRWRGHYVQPASRAMYGDRRIRMWIPWVRTRLDAKAFAEEFFRRYSQPQNRYRLETLPLTETFLPWMGRLRLLDREGEELFSSTIETVRVLFDHAPRFVIETGPDDPRVLWPEPEHDERFEIPRNPPEGYGGDVVTFEVDSEGSGVSSDGVGGSSSEGTSSDEGEESSSLLSSGWSSGASSLGSSEMSSGESREGSSGGWSSESSGWWSSEESSGGGESDDVSSGGSSLWSSEESSGWSSGGTGGWSSSGEGEVSSEGVTSSGLSSEVSGLVSDGVSEAESIEI